MTSPGGVERGRVSVRVLPDTSHFTKDLEAYLNRIEHTLKVEIPTVLDASGLIEDARRAVRAAEAAATARIPAELDDSQLDESLLKNREKASKSPPVEIPAEVENPIDAQFRANLARELRRATANLDARIPADVDGDRLRAELGATIAEIEKTLRVELPADVEKASAIRTKLRAQLAAVQASLPPIEIPVEIAESPIDAAFRARTQAQLKKLASDIDVRVPVGVDGANMRRILGEKLAELEKTLKVEIPVDPAKAAELRAKIAGEIAGIQASLPPVEVEVEPEPETEAKLRARLALIANRVSGQHVDLRVDLHQDDIRRASEQVLKLGTQLSALGLGALGGQAAAGGVLALASALSEVVGAIALLPAAGAAGAVAISTLAIGFQGFGDALASANTPAALKKQQEALAKLAPEARETALAFKQLAPAAQDLRKSVQNALFKDLADDVQKLGKSYLPVLKSGFTGVAQEMNAGTQAFARFLESSQSIKDTQTIFGNVKQALHDLVPAGTAFGQALRDITTVGSSFLPGLAQGFTQVAQRMADFISHARETGQLNDFIANALHTIGQLADILGNVGRIFGAVFKAGADSGNSLLSIIGDVTDSIADFLNSLQGQVALRTFFDSAAQAARALMPVFAALVNVIASIAPVLADVGTAVAPAFGRALNAIALAVQKAQPGIVAFAKGFADFIDAITPAIPAVADLANTLGKVLGNALRTLGPAVGTVIQALAKALEAAAPGIDAFATGFSSFLTALAPALPAIGELARVLGQALGDALKQIGPVLADVAEALAGAFAQALPVVIPLITDMATIFLNIYKAAAPLIPPLSKLAYTILDAFAKVIGKLVPPLAEFVTKLVDGLAPYIDPLVNAFLDLVDALLPLVDPFLQLVTDVFEPLLPLLGPIADILGVIADVLKPIAELLGAILTAVGKAIEGLGNFISFVGEGLSNMFTLATNGFNTYDATTHGTLSRLNGYWDQHGKFVRTTTGTMVEDVVALFLGIPNRAQKAWTSLKTDAQLGFDLITNGAQNTAYDIVAAFLGLPSSAQKAWSQLGSDATAAFNKLPGGAKRGADGAAGQIGRLPATAKSILDGLGSTLFGSGQAATKGFADGMASNWALTKARLAAQQVVNAVSAFFPSSPAKEGPFSGRGWTPYRGQALAEGFTEGMLDRLALVKNTAAQLMSAASDQIGTDGALLPAAAASGGHTFNLYQAPGQSTESMAAAVDRRLGFTGRIS